MDIYSGHMQGKWQNCNIFGSGTLSWGPGAPIIAGVPGGEACGLRDGGPNRGGAVGSSSTVGLRACKAPKELECWTYWDKSLKM